MLHPSALPPRKAPEMPVLTEAEKHTFLTAQVEQLQAHLIREHGVDPETAKTLASKGREKMYADSKLLGPELLIRGGVARGREAIATLAFDLVANARSEAHGPHPVALLRDRLIAGGMAPDAAAEAAVGRAWRDAQGRIVTRLAVGEEVTGRDAEDLTFITVAANRIAREAATAAPLSDEERGEIERSVRYVL